jgi:hypothetical protein
MHKLLYEKRNLVTLWELYSCSFFFLLCDFMSDQTKYFRLLYYA